MTETIVYRYTNKINGKMYVGITKKSLEKRRKEQHRYNAKKGSKCYFHRAIMKYGWNNFKYEVMCYCSSRHSAGLMEKELIKQFKLNDSRYGYNLTTGGDSDYEAYGINCRNVVVYDIDGNYINEFSTLSKCAEFIDTDVTNVWCVCKGKCYSLKGYVIRYKGDSFDKFPVHREEYFIFQYDKNLNLIGKYINAKEAEEHTGIKDVTIRKALTRSGYSGGYYWSRGVIFPETKNI